jgi:uncharacterized protein (DUF885 family)
MSALRILVFLAVSFAAHAAQPLPAFQTASQRLEWLAKEAWERSLDLFPVGETLGSGTGPRQDRLELTYTVEHRGRQRRYHRWVLEQLDGIPADELQESERLTHQLLMYRSRIGLEGLSHPFHLHYVFIHLDGGVANNLVRLVGRQPFRHEGDYRAWLRRLKRYPEFLDGVAGLMRRGVVAGITIPRAIVERSLSQLKALAPDPQDIATSTLWRPVTRFPASMDTAARERFEIEYYNLLVQELFPAIHRLAAFVEAEYLPHARTTDGFGDLPGGESLYRLLIRSQTTTEMSAEEIHELGLREVARIQARLIEAGVRAGFNGPVKDMRRWLASNPENFPFTSGEQVIEYLRRLHAKIVPQLPRLFGRLPRARFDIRLTERVIAASAPAQWYPPSDDGTRPGVFAIPVVDPRTRSTFGLASLLAHEGMPGHHLEGGIRLENGFPAFRRRLWVAAFGEGWALYAEHLGHELGLYDEPLTLMGRYGSELLRACRLVADTGLHARGWSRERVVRYLIDECGASETRAANEALRYMAWPAQALSYKIGELTIRDIRANAERRLGSRFDIRAFHDAFLAEGHLPLSMARERMDAWIEEQGARR